MRLQLLVRKSALEPGGASVVPKQCWKSNNDMIQDLYQCVFALNVSAGCDSDKLCLRKITGVYQEVKIEELH